MKKELKDYLHFYKDCIVKVKRMLDDEYHVGRVCEITSKSNHGDWIEVWFDDVITVTSNTWNTSSSNAHHFFFSEDDIFPFLRRLSDMTEEEALEIGLFNPKNEIENTKWQDVKDRVNGFIERGGEPSFTASQFLRLLSEGFDLFGLIEAGIAIDATTIKAEI